MCVSYLSSIILYTMAQQILNTSEAPENFRTLKTDDISKDEMKPGLLFANEEVALNAILKWGELTLCPIMKARRDKTPPHLLEGIPSIFIISYLESKDTALIHHKMSCI